MAQQVERRLGKAEVGGSSPLGSFKITPRNLDFKGFLGFSFCLEHRIDDNGIIREMIAGEITKIEKELADCSKK